ncbi:MAG: hypothetical protein HYX90_00240 [Chloroflexi bacterium]|nr:hypothetical protein [Chloroflexota bacterium]
MSDLKETIRQIADNLTNLEINTIIKPNMTGGKMPHPRHALISIAQDYGRKLRDISEALPQDKRTGLDIKQFSMGKGTYDFEKNVYSPIATGPALPGNETKHVHPGGYDYFAYLRRFACETAKAVESVHYKSREADLVMLYRIRDASDQIKGVFNALKARTEGRAIAPGTVEKKTKERMTAANQEVVKDRKGGVGRPEEGYKEGDYRPAVWDNNYTREEIETHRPLFPLTADELITIRKVWEIGTEVIAIQTVIQLDGDVVTRINPDYALIEKKMIHDIHHDQVNFSLQAWKELVGLVRDFFENIVKFFAPKGPNVP